MDRNLPVRTSHSCMADLLAWPNEPAEERSPTPSSRLKISFLHFPPSLKPADRISPAMFGAPMTKEEAEIVNKRRSCSALKLQDMNGNGIFAIDDDEHNASNQKTSIRIFQKSMGAISQILLGTEGIETPRKPTSFAELAKQRELRGTIESELEQLQVKKQLSEAKCKELSGSGIFALPPEIPQRHLAAQDQELRNNLDFESSQLQTKPASVNSHLVDAETITKKAKKICNQKFKDLMGNDTFRGGAVSMPAEKQLSLSNVENHSSTMAWV
ncbi:hypothetical protein ZIOFF_037949 [Zingiber officinale]|uniref:DUF4057 domain-containing protein n=1 Tax=Zingiber officinale TaxID=94328 RepID=A0A8J5LAC3_ZINOF|nr:hypothetical protein ZIOFF_037949 [Zingiber officinale]